MNWWTVLILIGLLLVVLLILRLVIFWRVFGIRFWRRQIESMKEAEERMKRKSKEFEERSQRWGRWN